MNLIERIEELAKIGETSEGICRAAGSIEDIRGKSLVINWMLEDGLTVYKDTYGNIIGKIPGEGPPIVMGSHTDTVATAGKYDGVLGVLAGLEVVKKLEGPVSYTHLTLPTTPYV